MPQLTSISEIESAPELLREVTVLTRIESFLEDINLEPVKLEASFDMGSWGRRRGVFHASSVGSLSGKSLCGRYPMGCGRELYYSFTGAPSEDAWDPRTRRILDTGSAVHAQLQSYLSEIARRSGGEETFTPEADIDPNKNEVADMMDLSGHTDGVYLVDNGRSRIRFGLEIKTINDAGYKGTGGPHAEHKIQGTIYQKCLDLPVMLFLYYNKNDSNIVEYPHVYDPNMWKAIEDKLNFVRDHVMGETEPPQEVGWQCNRCKYKSTCKPPKVRKAGKAIDTAKFSCRRRQ